MGLFRRVTKKSLILINVLIAIALIAGCNSKYFNPSTFWLIGILSIASPYLFICVFAFLFFWLFTKKKIALICFFTIIILWKPLGHIFKFRWKSDFEIAKKMNIIRVMSWNVEQFKILEHKKNPQLKEEMFYLINQYKPDIACFQEMVASNAYPKAINYMPTMATAINFPNNYYSYNELDNFDDKHHFGRVIFSKYPIINRKTINFSNRSYENCFQYVDVIKETDTLRVFNIHLQSLSLSQENKAYIDDATNKKEVSFTKSKSIFAKLKYAFLQRQTQAEVLHSEIEQSPYPTILCGDFNDVPNSYAYGTIADGLKNAFAEKGSGVSRTFTGISPTLRIDNIFVSNQFDVQQYTRPKEKISDHYPILSDVVLKK